MSVNKAIILGNLGKDPEVKILEKSQLTVTNFNVATSYKEETEWHSIVCYGKTAEACGEYLKKGSKIYVEGRLTTRSWEKDGVKHYKTEIIADRVEFLSKKQTENEGGF